jgi:ATP-dependent RNA helicase RhlE
MSFDNLGLEPEILRAIAEQGYTTPTEIQSKAIPRVLEKRDVMARAKTESS